MQDTDAKVKDWLDSLKQILTSYFSLPAELLQKLNFAFEDQVKALKSDQDKYMYLTFIHGALNGLDKGDYHQQFLLSLADVDIRDKYIPYTTPIETDGQDWIFIFYVWMVRYMEGLKAEAFHGVEFVHRYAIGCPKPERVKTDKGHYVEIKGDIETGQWIDLTKHFDSISAIRVFESPGQIKQGLWPLKVIFTAGRWKKTIVLLQENDLVDVGYGKDVPCHKQLAPLTIGIFPHNQDPGLKFYVDVLGKLNMGEARHELLEDLHNKKINYREFGFQLSCF